MILSLALATGCARNTAPYPEDVQLLDLAHSIRSDRVFTHRWTNPVGSENAVVVRIAEDLILPPAVLRFYRRRSGSWNLAHEDWVLESTPWSEDGVIFKDLSGDGFPEVWLLTCYGSGGLFYDVWRQDPARGSWKKAAEGLGNPRWVPEAGCVFDWSRSGWGGFFATRWDWRGDLLVARDTVYQQAHFQKTEGKKDVYLYEISVYRGEGDSRNLVRKYTSREPHPWGACGDEESVPQDP